MHVNSKNMEIKFKKVRTLKDIQNDPRVSAIDIEYDNGEKSYWCYLKAGWQDSCNPTCHTIHEWRIKEVCYYVNNAIPFPDDPELK